MSSIKNYQSFLLENKLNRDESIDEGFKDILMGLVMLSGLVGGNANAQSSKSDLVKSANEIESVLKDDFKLNSAIDKLEEMGMTDAAVKIKNNAESMILKLNDLKKNQHVSTQNTNDLSVVMDKLTKGWAISSIVLDTVIGEIKEIPNVQEKHFVFDTLQRDFNSSELFKEGSFELKDFFKNDLVDLFSSMDDESVVVKIVIESSTDKQRVVSGGSLQKNLTELGLSTDNKGLSKARNNSVLDVLTNIFNDGNSETPKTEQLVKWEQGKGELNSVEPQDPSARYVSIKIYTSRLDSLPEEKETKYSEETQILVHNFSLKKVFNDSNEIVKKNYGGFKKKTVKFKGMVGCPVFK